MLDDYSRNIKFIVEYDGTAYCGWQIQKNGPTIQAALQEVLQKLTGEPVSVTGSGRTDAGVHALGQVANFKTNSKIPCDRLPLAMNSLLPSDIVVKFAEDVHMDFHASFSALGKTYRYLILNSRIPDAFLRNRAYFYPQRLNFNAMCEAAGKYTGTHDFAAFRAVGSHVKTSVRTIFKSTLECVGDMITFEVTGNGFLYNMVRIMTGTLLEVGSGKMQPGDITHVLDACDRTLAGITVPPQGLYMVEVYYNEKKLLDLN